MEKKQIKIGSNRSFGIVFFIFFLIVSLWPLMNGENIRLWSLVVSIIFLILGIINSKILNPLNSLWFKFGLFLGKIIFMIPRRHFFRLFTKGIMVTKDQSFWLGLDRIYSPTASIKPRNRQAYSAIVEKRRGL